MPKLEMLQSKKRRVLVIALAFLLLSFAVFMVIASAPLDLANNIYNFIFLLLFCALALMSLLVTITFRSKRAHIASKTIIALVCILAALSASELLAGSSAWTLLTSNPLAFSLSFLLLLSLALFFFALTGSVPWGIRGMTIAVALFCLVNYFVSAFRGTPFIPTDILGVGTAMDVASNYYFFWTSELTASLLIFAAIFILAPRLKLPKPKRWISATIRLVALILPIIFVGITVQRDFVRGHNLEAYTWDQTIGARLNGSIWNFYANISESFASPPSGYSLEAVQEIASQYTSDSVRDAEVLPDVVLILGESWADITPEGYVEASETALPFMQGLEGQSNSDYRSLITSAYGGGTSRSEFHVLTGASQVYGTSQAPFQFDVTEHIPNLLDTFKALGYDTTAIHTGKASSWGRETAFPLMGFDAYLDKESLTVAEDEYLRGWIRDSVLYDSALAVLDTNDTPQFLYLITIATHGEYRTEDYEAHISITDPLGDFPLTEQYLSVLHTSDEDLAHFIQQLEQREKPTIVVFFGDHLPNIDTSYTEEVLAPSDSRWWDYKTVYGVWANYELPDTSYDEAEYLSINYLGPYLIEKAGLPLTGYQKFLKEGAEEYSVTALSGFETPDGRFTPIEEARETDFYFEQAVIQYNFIYDRNKLPEDFFFLRE